jgi:hypothetical protein
MALAPHVDGDPFWGLARSRRRGPLPGAHHPAPLRVQCRVQSAARRRRTSTFPRLVATQASPMEHDQVIVCAFHASNPPRKTRALSAASPAQCPAPARPRRASPGPWAWRHDQVCQQNLRAVCWRDLAFGRRRVDFVKLAQLDSHGGEFPGGLKPLCPGYDDVMGSHRGSRWAVVIIDTSPGGIERSGQAVR